MRPQGSRGTNPGRTGHSHSVVAQAPRGPISLSPIRKVTTEGDTEVPQRGSWYKSSCTKELILKKEARTEMLFPYSFSCCPDSQYYAPVLQAKISYLLCFGGMARPGPVLTIHQWEASVLFPRGLHCALGSFLWSLVDAGVGRRCV